MRRMAVARMGPAADAEVKPVEGKEEGDGRTIIQKLFSDIGPRFQDRPGGYTRVIKRHERRLGDGGKTAYLELLKEGETRTRVKRVAPAPRVEEEPREKVETTHPPEESSASTSPPPETPPAPSTPTE